MVGANIMCICQICSSRLIRQIDVKGFSNLWSDNLSSYSIFTFFACDNCGFIWNSDYGDFSFTPTSYDNYTAISDSDQKEQLLARKIGESVSYTLQSPTHDLNIIEVGSGKRLGMLKELSTLLPNADIFAVDPVLSEQRVYLSANKFISTSSDLFDLKVPPESFSILVFRNSLEYFSPADLKEAFNKFFNYGGLLVAELTNIDIAKQGFCHLYSECLNFYKLPHIFSLLGDCALSSLPLETAIMHGAERTLSVIKIFSNKEKRNTFVFRSLENLLSSLEKCVATNNSASIMYAAGGRNIMGVLNHLEGKVEGVYDSDAARKTSLLPFALQFVERASIPSSYNIVLLNSSFLSYVRELFPDNPIFVLAPT